MHVKAKDMLTFFEAQCKYPVKGDWVSGVRDIIKKCKINLIFSEIKNMKESQYQAFVRKQILETAFSCLKSQIK